MDLDDLCRALGHSFDDGALLRRALTHRSYGHEQDEPHNERLEFLGDAVFGLVTAEWLYRRRPEQPEGELAKLKSFLVSGPVLAAEAKRLGLGELLRLGVGEERSGGREKQSLLSDAMEAVLGAVYLEGGLAAARAMVEPILEKALRERGRYLRTDAKTALQEIAQARGWDLPDYRLVETSGPDHDRSFAVEVWVDGQCVGEAEGRSKKRAEQRAAGEALERLRGSSAG